MGFGFFVQEEALQQAVKAQRKARTPRSKEPQALDPKAVGCDNCTLKPRWNSILSPQMRTVKESDEADILILGEAPGEQEDHEGVPFVGKSGQFLRRCLPGRKLERFAWQNAVRCRPEDNRNPTLHELHACGTYLERDIEKLQPKAILGVGGVPLSRFITTAFAGITDIHGIRFPVSIGTHKCWYYPIFHPSYLLRMGGDESPAWPVFQNDIRRFLQTVDKWPEPQVYALTPEDVTCAYTEAEARAIVAQLEEPIAIDIETPGLRPFKVQGKILTAALSDGLHTVAFPLNHPEAPNEWGWQIVKEIITTKRWIAHSAGFELLWFWYNMGPDWQPGPFEDTMALARIFHERHTVLSLAVLSLIHLGQNVKLLSDIDLSRVSEYPLSTVLPYNGLDALATILLYHQLNGKPSRWQVQKILDSTKAVTRMQLMGLPVDHQEAQDLHDHFNALRMEAERKAKELYEVKQFQLTYQEAFNIGSGEHIGKALVEFGRVDMPKTDKKKVPKTDEETLAKIDNPLATLVVEYREASKICGTYLESVLDGRLLGEDGLLHPAYTVMLTRTLRLSGEDPNIQNYPKRKHREVRRYIKAPPGHIFVACDQGQLEARVIAMASKDRWLCESILTGYDIHADWRDRLLKIYPAYMDRLRHKSGEKNEKELLKAGRNNIKNDFVFASFFGSSVRNCAENTGAPLRIMQELADDFWYTFPGVKRWIKAQRAEYRSSGSVSTLTGRRRYQVMMGNEPINTPIQGTAADIVQETQNELCELSLAERDPYLMPRMNLHDDLTFILPDDERLEGYIQRVADVQVKRRFPFMVVPLTVEVNVGYNWADLSEIAKFTGDYYR
jgi:uracil-DNA glycosylase family 4